MMLYLKLFWEFFKAGLFAIGGGMATVPFLQEISRKTGWYTAGDLADMIAVSESPIAGIFGGILSTVGLVMPSVIIILIVARFLEKFRENRYVNAAMYGLRAASVALISSAGISIVMIAVFQINSIEEWKAAVIDYRCFVLAVLVLIMTRWVPKVKDLHPIIFIIASAVIGIVFHMSVPI